jgi:hypothetical protein
MSRQVVGGSQAEISDLASGKADAVPRELPSAVLFACTMNAVRSVMAAEILRHLAGQRTYVRSAGVRAGEPDPFVAIGRTSTIRPLISSSPCRPRRITRRSN